MSKNLLKELILPAFWLFFFAVSSKTDAKVNELKKTNIPVSSETSITSIKDQELSAPATNAANKEKEATFTKAIYLSKY